MTLKKKPHSTPYYSFGQQRLDYWTELKNECNSLANIPAGSKESQKHILKIEELLSYLKTVSPYYAFPGKANPRPWNAHREGSVSIFPRL